MANSKLYKKNIMNSPKHLVKIPPSSFVWRVWPTCARTCYNILRKMRYRRHNWYASCVQRAKKCGYISICIHFTISVTDFIWPISNTIEGSQIVGHWQKGCNQSVYLQFSDGLMHSLQSALCSVSKQNGGRWQSRCR